MAAYDPLDFAANPEKYRLFKTARVAQTIESSPDLTAGTFVKIRYWGVKPNSAYGGGDMPIYETWPENRRADEPSLIYAGALGDFAL